ncbi:melatonin receptor type 1B-like [Liolophura sinensis]|uniref:melatonin receptor type 1B-like n=1 Tax=Liolophura sinensis TaxID=3198878 RepID=UPI0031590BD4
MDLPYLFNSTKIGPFYLRTHLDSGIPYLVCMGVIMLTGTVGNILVVGAVLTTKALRTMGNIFILNLAFADLCVTAIVDPFSIIGFVLGEVYFEDKPALCELVACICLTSCFCSLLSIGAISINRYIHICHHQVYPKIFTFRNTVLITIGLWVVSFLCEMPNFFGWGDHVYDRKTLSCIYDRLADYSYTLFFTIGGIITPLVIIAICYLRIYLFVRGSTRKIRDTQEQHMNLPKKGKNDLKFVRTLFIIFLIFSVCWMPYVIVVLYDKHDRLSSDVHTYVVLLAHINSSMNSVLYGITNRHFRMAYKRLLCIDKCCKKKRRISEDNSITNMATHCPTFLTSMGGSPKGVSYANRDELRF